MSRKRVKFFLILVAICLLISNCSYAIEPMAEKLFSEARDLLLSKETEKAYAKISEAISIDANEPIFYLLRADILYLLKASLEQILNDLGKAEKLNPYIPHIYRTRSWVFQEAGNNIMYICDEYKADLLDYLAVEKKRLPDKVFSGMTYLDFQSLEGKTGYILSTLSLDFKEDLPIPTVGMKTNFICGELEVINGRVAIINSDDLPVKKDGYEITAYNFLTGFLDSSGDFYMLYYQVKFKKI